MLKLLRNKKTAKKIWWFLAIIIVPAFVLWGSGSMTRSQREKTSPVIRIFGKNISPLEYQEAQEAARNQMIIQYGEDLTEAKKYINLEQQALQRLILLAEAKRRKIQTSDQEVIELIESYPFFQKNGKFNNVIYTQTLQYVLRAQPRAFEEQTRQNIAIFKLYKQVTDQVTLSDAEIKEEYLKSNEELSVYYISASFLDFAKNITPSEEETSNYFSANSFKFKQPLSFNIEYILINAKDRKDAETINETVKNIVARLRKNEDFLKIAQELKLSIKETGLFAQTDPIPQIGWSADILSLISKAKTGQYLPPVYSDNNYYIMMVKERKESYIPDFAVIKDKAKEALIKDKAEETAKEKIENCLAKLKELYAANPKEVNLAKVAQEYGLKFNSTGLFKYGSYIENIGSSDSFWMATHNLKEGELSDLISMPSGFYILKLQARIPIDEKKFELDKTEFSKKLLAEKKEGFFFNFVKELQRKSQLL